MTKIIPSSLAAGFCIGLGGAVFLLQTEKLVGAVLFCLGLYTICEMQFHLFTGRVCYALEQPLWQWLRFPVIWCGNWLGTGLAAGLLSLTRVGPAARQAAQSCSSVALGSPHSRFSRIVPENRVFFCRTTLTASRRCSIV